MPPHLDVFPLAALPGRRSLVGRLGCGGGKVASGGLRGYNGFSSLKSPVPQWKVPSDRRELHRGTHMQARFYLPMYGRFASPDPGRDQHFEQTQSWNIYSYVQNNPVMNFDPNGEFLVPIGTEKEVAQYKAAIAYLKNAPGMAYIINKLEKSETTYVVKFNNDNDDSYNRTIKTVTWDPTSALAATDSLGNMTGETQSPALGLGHELTHAKGDDSGTMETNAKGSDAQYQTKEERRAIDPIETNAAKKLGEGTRDNHYGRVYRTKNPTSRKPVEKNKTTKELKNALKKSKKEEPK